MKAPFRPAGKRPWSRALGEFVTPLIAPVMAKQGFGESDIIMHWPEIVGARLAQVSEPMRLQWPPQGSQRDPAKPKEPATLHVRVDGGLAIEMQHMSGVIIERVNAHLGWRCVGRIAIKQGPLAGGRRGKKKRTAPDAAALALGAEAAQGVSDEALRAALARLGARVLGKG